MGVVELPILTERARHRSSGELRFFTNPSDAAQWLGNVDLLHSVGALPCVTDGIATTRMLLNFSPRTVLWAKIFLGPWTSFHQHVVPLSSHGPGPIDGVDDHDVVHTFATWKRTKFLAAHCAYHMVWQDTNTDNGTENFLFQSRARVP